MRTVSVTSSSSLFAESSDSASAPTITGINFRLVQAIGAAPAALGSVESQIGILQQLVAVDRIVRRDRDSDAGVGHEFTAVNLVGHIDGFANSSRESHGVGNGLDRPLNDGKFVAAQSADRNDFSDAATQSIGHALEQCVTDR